MYDALSNLSSAINIEQVMSMKNELRDMKMNDDDQAYTTKFKKFKNTKKFVSRKKPNKEKDMSKIECFNFLKYCH
jgi:hypothetical protein